MTERHRCKLGKVGNESEQMVVSSEPALDGRAMGLTSSFGLIAGGSRDLRLHFVSRHKFYDI